MAAVKQQVALGRQATTVGPYTVVCAAMKAASYNNMGSRLSIVGAGRIWKQVQHDVKIMNQWLKCKASMRLSSKES
jgi:hypothetical protein